MMISQTTRLLLLPLRKQLTCTVRASAVVIPVKSYHTPAFSSIFISQSRVSKLIVKDFNVKFCSSRQLSLSSYSRNGAPLGGISSAAAVTTTNSSEFIDIPAPPVPTSTTLETLSDAVSSSSLAEPAFTEIGLGGMSPSGLIQSILEWLHIGVDLPWWGCIAIGVFTVRTLMFPLVIKAQRNAAKMTNNMPQLQVLQQKMTDARQAGNAMEAARMGYEIQSFMKEKGLNPLKNLMVPLIQAPVFMSFFFALKGMANAPVESMQYGGLFWFSDLTVCDPYYILPMLTSVTVWATMELGADSAKLSSQGFPLLIYFFRAIPFIMFPITMNFSGAILCYWLTTNVISLVQVGFLRLPKVRSYFDIDPIVVVQPVKGAGPKKGFVEGMKEAWNNQKITAELNDRQRLIDSNFRRAGTGPIQKTYSYNPTAAPKAQELVQKGFKQTKKSV
ncbi:mitochondrial inner membrane protein OXA1L-like [Daphnia pulex]|uniref:mitochondrial inner membrane protein OXA1L-like n=1 Tax=Daphnia pulex TaxID=6669 RepID=UPI001EDD790E|nr:mitochondrial inner membrane protein OXA1L-like [Daphnia pulex]XP_046455548.1 mitochondrial inner membrane protein OXA1L-like [Daphnia pulex]